MTSELELGAADKGTLKRIVYSDQFLFPPLRDLQARLAVSFCVAVLL